MPAGDVRLRVADPPQQPEAVRASIASWLLGETVQVRAGQNRGAVPGTIAADGQPLYLYPEITGYFLQWLAWRAAQDTLRSSLAPRAAAAQAWLAAWASIDPPPTRIYLRGQESDWRNSALFAFDLAMVLRGLASAREVGLIREDRRLTDRVVAQLSRLIAPDGMLVACVAAAPDCALPDRWSTRRGAFLTKAAAGILAAARTLAAVTPALREAARTTLVASVQAAVTEPHSDIHPLLYAIEGALSPDADDVASAVLPRLAQQIDGLLDRVQPSGLLKEDAAQGSRERIDAVAQCLRAASILRARVPRWSPDSEGLNKLSRALLRHIDPEGCVPFAADESSGQCNVWTALFAEQALGLAAPLRSASLVLEARRWLV